MIVSTAKLEYDIITYLSSLVTSGVQVSVYLATTESVDYYLFQALLVALNEYH